MKTLHCTLDDLLEVREGEGTGAARRHLEACDACRAELDRLHQRVAALKALPALRPPRDRWPVVRDMVRAQAMLLDALGIGDRRAAADAADAARGRRTVLPWRSDHGQLALATVTSGTCGRRPCQRFAMNSPQQRLLAGTHGISAGPSARDSAMTNSVHGATARKC